LHYYLELMGDMRAAIEVKEFSAFRTKFAEQRASGVDT
jgi:queuine tRNA-ribosyltransferase